MRAATLAAEAAGHPWLAAKLRLPLSHSWYGKPADLGERTIRAMRAVYYGLIGEVDHHLGRILQALAAQGERARTLIVFTADHGEMLGDHWLLGKDGFFPQAFHVPLIIADPAAPAGRGRIVDAFTEHVDLLPTLLERIGAEVPLQCDGQSLLPWLAGAAPAGWRTAAHFEHDFRDVEKNTFERALGLPSGRCALAVRQSAGFAYVHFNGLPPLGYDLTEDPQQLRSIAADPARAAAVLAEAQAMLSWRMDTAERRLTGCKLTPAGVVGRF